MKSNVVLKDVDDFIFENKNQLLLKRLFLVFFFFFFCHFFFQEKATALSSSAISVESPRIFIPPKGSQVTAGYAVLSNSSDKKIKLTLESVEGFKAWEMHQTISKNGQMKMQKIEEIFIEPKSKFEFQPGGSHLMLFDPNREFKPQEKVKVIFVADGQKLETLFSLIQR